MVSNFNRLPDEVPGGFPVSLGCSTAEVLRTSRGYDFDNLVQNARLSRRLSRGLLGEGAPAPRTEFAKAQAAVKPAEGGLPSSVTVRRRAAQRHLPQGEG